MKAEYPCHRAQDQRTRNRKCLSARDIVGVINRDLASVACSASAHDIKERVGSAYYNTEITLQLRLD